MTDKSPLLELLLNFKESVHRVIVKENNTNELLRIVSQSDMLQFIRANLTLCGDVRTRECVRWCVRVLAAAYGCCGVSSGRTHR